MLLQNGGKWMLRVRVNRTCPESLPPLPLPTAPTGYKQRNSKTWESRNFPCARGHRTFWLFPSMPNPFCAVTCSLFLPLFMQSSSLLLTLNSELSPVDSFWSPHTPQWLLVSHCNFSSYLSLLSLVHSLISCSSLFVQSGPSFLTLMLGRNRFPAPSPSPNLSTVLPLPIAATKSEVLLSPFTLGLDHIC